jgi:hypothetical protein
LSTVIAYDIATGTVTISATGVYYVNWWLAADGIAGDGTATVPTFAIATSTAGTFLASSPIGSGQFSGNALIFVAAVPVTFQLVSAIDSTTFLGVLPVRADLTILNVSV